MNIRILIASLRESVSFAYQSIRSNLLRTLLSLLGITIGVFCIISILTLVDSMQYSIQNSLSKLGDRVVFVQKWPWLFSNDYPWWKYINRPELKYREMEVLQKRFPQAEAISFSVWANAKKLNNGNNSAESVTIRGLSLDYDKVMELSFEDGRFFNESESQSGEPVIVLGNQLAHNLFPGNLIAIGKSIEAYGRKMRVIGVLSKEGQGLGADGGGQDMQAMVPLNFIRNINNIEDGEFNPSILVKAPKNANLDAFEEELHGVMRSIRKLSPRQEDDYATNKITMLTSFITGFFKKVSLYGWIIAGFSILVGGFGIANIMFVSVQERTHIIGIQKAIGAKSYMIMIQFLGEAIMLCILGGLIGLALIFILSQLLNMVFPFKLILTLKNSLIGVGLSSFIGVLSGYFPSRKAAKLDPITAIRYKI